MLTCLDECQVDESLWLISLLENARRTAEEPLKIVILTSKGTTGDERIAERLSKMPKEAFDIVDCCSDTANASDVGLAVSILINTDSRYADQAVLDELIELMSSWERDDDLVELFVSVLKSSQDHLRILSLLHSSLTTASDLVFELALEEIPVEHRPWAQNIFSWVLASRRPLRVCEFHVVSQLCDTNMNSNSSTQWYKKGHPANRYEVNNAIRRLRGLLRIQHGEIHFGHMRFRAWISGQTQESHSSKFPSAWYFQQREGGHDADILDMCLTYLSHLPDLDVSNLTLPYAIEYWTYHYKSVANSQAERVLTEVFWNEETLRRWISLYGSLSTLVTKPLPDCQHALAIATHFDLNDIIRRLLAGTTHEIEAWTEAMLESVRNGDLSTLHLILDATPVLLTFDDPILHQMVLEASSRGDAEILLDVLQRVQKPLHPIPDWKSLMTGKSDGSGESFLAEDTTGISRRQLSHHDDSVDTNQDDITQLKPQEGKGDHPADEQSTPFDWLSPAIYQASKFGLQDAVNLLLTLGANPNSLGWTGKSALAAACRRGHTNTARSLLDHGASVEKISGPNDYSPLVYACASGNAETVKLLLHMGASPEAKRKSDGWMPLHHACDWGTFTSVEALLTHKRFDEYSTTGRIEPLPIAVRRGKYQVTETLLRHGLDPNSHIESGSALWHAVTQRRLDLVQLLLDRKADPDFTPEGLDPPLVRAIKVGKIEIVKLLVDRGANIEKAESRATPKFHRTPLLTAVYFQNFIDTNQIVQYLLDNKADTNVVDELGYSPLWLAAYWGVSSFNSTFDGDELMLTVTLVHRYRAPVMSGSCQC